MMLKIVDFPLELAEQVKARAGEATLSKAVVHMLYDLLETEQRYKALKLKNGITEAKLTDLIQACQLQRNAQSVMDYTLPRVCDENAFYLTSEI